ncbi:MarR family transcriptional regulator [Brevibacillus borstelensis]|uniref:MarR family winged helix-turn-helix transcriptional regulator n=1 Tax=Brevibacillus borstelensis TaxID=45462 RepID=UPI002E20D42D|nr:MarR family transcriptional regulator [Brevibacillus borstelensis]MED1852200.1 MarR family transcriptional regulator [Brevibacillus borstelensis]
MKELIQLAKLLREANAVFSSISEEELDTQDLTWQQVLILEQIKDGPKTIGEISKAVELPYSTTSGLVNRLEREDLVKRLRDGNDRRIVWVSPTLRITKGEEVESDESYVGTLEGKTAQISHHSMSFTRCTPIKKELLVDWKR